MVLVYIWTNHGDIVDAELIGAEQANDEEGEVENVGYDHAVHEAHEVEHGTLQDEHLLLIHETINWLLFDYRQSDVALNMANVLCLWPQLW